MQAQSIQDQLFPVTGTVPKHTNPFYQLTYHTPQITPPTNYPPPIEHPERILASTPTTSTAPPMNTIPNLTPPPGFEYFTHAHEQGFIHSPHEQTRTAKDMSMTQDDNLINVEDSVGDASQIQVTQTRTSTTRTTNIFTSGLFEPIRGINTLPRSVLGCVLNTKRDQEIASEM